MWTLPQSGRQQSRAPIAPGRSSRASFKLWLLRFCRCRFRTCRRAATHFTNFETHEAPDGNAFAELGDRLSDHLADCHALVLDVVLFVESILLVELLHFARDDFLDDLLRLAGSQRLRPIDFALLLEHVRGDFLAPHIARIERGDVHGDVVRKLLKCFRARHEVRLAVQLHDHADLSASVDVAAHQAFAGFARSFLGCSCLALLAQNADGFFDVAIGFDERGAAITEARVGPFPQFLDELGRNLHGRLLCTHSSFPCSLKSSCVRFLQNGPPRAARGGPLQISHPRSALTLFFVRRHRGFRAFRSEEHTSELQSHHDLVCRLLLEKKKKNNNRIMHATNKVEQLENEITNRGYASDAPNATPRNRDRYYQRAAQADKAPSRGRRGGE